MNGNSNYQSGQAIKPKTISLFAGIGGCSLSFQGAGYDVVFASDIDCKAVATYKANFPKTLCEQSDISKLDFYSLLKRLNIESDEIDIVIGGPPCQGFSSAGMQFWDDPRNAMFKRYVAALEVIQPNFY